MKKTVSGTYWTVQFSCNMRDICIFCAIFYVNYLISVSVCEQPGLVWWILDILAVLVNLTVISNWKLDQTSRRGVCCTEQVLDLDIDSARWYRATVSSHGSRRATQAGHWGESWSGTSWVVPGWQFAFQLTLEYERACMHDATIVRELTLVVSSSVMCRCWPAPTGIWGEGICIVCGKTGGHISVLWPFFTCPPGHLTGVTALSNYSKCQLHSLRKDQQHKSIVCLSDVYSLIVCFHLSVLMW